MVGKIEKEVFIEKVINGFRFRKNLKESFFGQKVVKVYVEEVDVEFVGKLQTKVIEFENGEKLRRVKFGNNFYFVIGDKVVEDDLYNSEYLKIYTEVLDKYYKIGDKLNFRELYGKLEKYVEKEIEWFFDDVNLCGFEKCEGEAIAITNGKITLDYHDGNGMDPFEFLIIKNSKKEDKFEQSEWEPKIAFEYEQALIDAMLEIFIQKYVDEFYEEIRSIFE